MSQLALPLARPTRPARPDDACGQCQRDAVGSLRVRVGTVHGETWRGWLHLGCLSPWITRRASLEAKRRAVGA